MNSEQITKVEKSIQNLSEKKSKIYFLVQDTKGNAKASISYIYNMALALFEDGFNTIILHEKNDYIGVGEWLDEEYMKIPHTHIEGQNLEVAPEDFIVIPEIYGFVMEQVSKLPCGKIVLTQAYDHILETLQPGQSWPLLGFHKCITTSNSIKEYLESVMRNVSYDIVEPYISDNFTKQKLPNKPIIAIHTRDQRDAHNLIKNFYLKFPQYRWITFKDMRGLTQSQFAEELKNCFLSVWIDETSSFGTFPLESMKTGLPVLGLVPNIIPEWMSEDNGLWINNKNQIVDYLADYVQNWLEDNTNPNIYNEMETTISKLQTKENFYKRVKELFSDYVSKRAKSFEEQLNKLQEVE
jgi:hypothetical protein